MSVRRPRGRARQRGTVDVSSQLTLVCSTSFPTRSRCFRMLPPVSDCQGSSSTGASKVEMGSFDDDDVAEPDDDVGSAVDGRRWAGSSKAIPKGRRVEEVR